MECGKNCMRKILWPSFSDDGNISIFSMRITKSDNKNMKTTLQVHSLCRVLEYRLNIHYIKNATKFLYSCSPSNMKTVTNHYPKQRTSITDTPCSVGFATEYGNLSNPWQAAPTSPLIDVATIAPMNSG